MDGAINEAYQNIINMFDKDTVYYDIGVEELSSITDEVFSRLHLINRQRRHIKFEEFIISMRCTRSSKNVGNMLAYRYRDYTSDALALSAGDDPTAQSIVSMANNYTRY